MKKNYIIVDNENRWLSTLVNATPEELRAEIFQVLETYQFEECFVYETIGEPTTIKGKL